MPPKLYRCLEPRYAAAFEAVGALRIGSIESYWSLEDAQQDHLDSSRVAVLAAARYEDAKSGAAIADAARRVGIDIGGGARNVSITNARATTRQPGLALCLTTDPWAETYRLSGKTGIIEFTNFYELAKALDGCLESRRLSRSMRHGQVRYDWAEIDAMNGPLPPADPFLKRAIFDVEAEYRLFWPATRPVPTITLYSMAIARAGVRIA